MNWLLAIWAVLRDKECRTRAVNLYRQNIARRKNRKYRAGLDPNKKHYVLRNG